jgi:hypothetical protein
MATKYPVMAGYFLSAAIGKKQRSVRKGIPARTSGFPVSSRCAARRSKRPGNVDDLLVVAGYRIRRVIPIGS